MSSNFALPTFIALIAFFVADQELELARFFYRKSLYLKDRNSVKERLARIGKAKDKDYENFRIAQLTYITLLLSLYTALFLFSWIHWNGFVLLNLVTPVVVLILTDRKLSDRCKQRKVTIEEEFPSVIEILTLAVGAGESPAAALKRIASRAHGHLAKELGEVVLQVEKGTPLTRALDVMSSRVESDVVRRFVDSMAISISRGTSLVDTLTHSANESRSRERVRLLAAAGKSEISMMIPVVFLILPISILFALYPSLTNLNLFSG